MVCDKIADMDVNDPQFAEYQAAFEKVAELAEPMEGAQPTIAGARYFLCLYGENGITPEEEFQTLKTLDDFMGNGLKKVTMQTGYWEDIVLYVI